MTTRRKEEGRPPDAKAMTKPWRKETIRLRLANISPKFVSKLKCDLPKAKIITKERQGKNQRKLIALLKLEDWKDFKKLCQIIEKNQIPINDCKFSVSLLTEGYMGGLRVPKVALKLLCRLGCELNFSFIKV